jgi:NTP pyrophosphatase (non-canonical NTP hydrolase)
MKGNFSNNLTPAQIERLAVLAKECGEVIQVIGKIVRHGYDSYFPGDPDRVTNRALLEKEIGDVKTIADMMGNEGDISKSAIQKRFREKQGTIGKWLHHQ